MREYGIENMDHMWVQDAGGMTVACPGERVGACHIGRKDVHRHTQCIALFSMDNLGHHAQEHASSPAAPPHYPCPYPAPCLISSCASRSCCSVPPCSLLIRACDTASLIRACDTASLPVQASLCRPPCAGPGAQACAPRVTDLLDGVQVWILWSMVCGVQ